jgi:hypothetical protein
MPLGSVASIKWGGSYSCSLELRHILEEEEVPSFYRRRAPCAHIRIDIDGGIIHGGPQTKQVTTNEFKLFKPMGDANSFLLYCAILVGHRMTVIFVYILDINPHAKVVDFAVVTIGK